MYVPGTGLLATGSNGTIRLWDVSAGKVVKELKDGHPAEVSALVVSPDGKWIISTGPDGTRGWDVAAGTELKDAVKQEQGTAWYGVTFVAADRIMFGNNSGVQRMIELPSGKELLRYKGFGGGIAYSPQIGLTTWQRRRLERQLRSTRDARVYRRTLAILEVGRCEPVAAVARRILVTRRAVHTWIGAYTRGRDPDALRDRDRSGRPRRLTDRGRELLRERLGRSPQDLGGFAAEWTVPLLRAYLARRLRRRPSEGTIRRELHRPGYAWKRSRYTLAPDPEAGGKKEGHPPADQAPAAPDRGAGRG